MKKKADKRAEVGKKGEEAAVRFLKDHGYKIIERNFTGSHGEIDIICDDGARFCFVEVRSRTANIPGGPALSVNWTKQKHIRSAANEFMVKNRTGLDLKERIICFDIIAVTFNEHGIPEIEFFKNAF